MKKALVLISVCLLANPLAANALTKHKKHHHKTDHAYKDTTVAAAATPAAPPATASWLDNVSGSFDLTTNYMFRGISLSQDNPAAQGGLTYTFPVGLYFNVWGSNANFTVPNGKTATSEFDTIVGWQGSFWTDYTYNINMDRYNYPGARDGNYNELNTLFSYKILQIGISYSANYSGTHASGTYYNGTLTFNIPPKYVLGINDVNIQPEMGHYSLAKLAGNSYNDYSLTVNKKISDKYTITAQWTDTNGRAKMPPYDGNQIVGTVTATF